MSYKVMIALNTTWNLINFRSGLIRALVNSGYEVVAVAPEDKYVEQLAELGCRYLPVPIDSAGTNPIRDLLLLLRFFNLIRIERPDVFLSYTVKPNIYGSIAAQVIGVPVINNIAGLGAVFSNQGILNWIVRRMYRFALFRSRKVFFQNSEDLRLFIEDGLVSPDVTDILPGSGIDLQKFKPLPLPRGNCIRFALIARLLWEKGVGEFVEAIRILRESGLRVDAILVGFLDVNNPSSISKSQIEEWVHEGIVTYLGASDDVRVEIALADCIVLPTFYREGTPRVLLEAAAMARPVITTDVPGCRDVVDNGVTGFLCRPRDASDLAEKMALIVSLPIDELEAMGLRGREKVELEFDESLVIGKYCRELDFLASSI